MRMRSWSHGQDVDGPTSKVRRPYLRLKTTTIAIAMLSINATAFALGLFKIAWGFVEASGLA